MELICKADTWNVLKVALLPRILTSLGRGLAEGHLHTCVVGKCARLFHHTRIIIIIASWRNNMVRGTARRKTTAKQVESFGQSVKGIQEPEHGLGSPKWKHPGFACGEGGVLLWSHFLWGNCGNEWWLLIKHKIVDAGPTHQPSLPQ